MREFSRTMPWIRTGIDWAACIGRALVARAVHACVCIVAAAWCGPIGAAESLEYPIKATYLYKFAPFIQWPAAAFPSAESPIVICVSGANPFGAVLDQAAAGQHVEGRTLSIRHLATIGADSGCHIAFLIGSAEQSVAQGLATLRDQPVLTVTDNATDYSSKGIVNFVIVDNRVRFEIDERAATQSHIAISSKLLSLSRQPGQTK